MSLVDDVIDGALEKSAEFLRDKGIPVTDIRREGDAVVFKFSGRADLEISLEAIEKKRGELVETIQTFVFSRGPDGVADDFYIYDYCNSRLQHGIPNQEVKTPCANLACRRLLLINVPLNQAGYPNIRLWRETIEENTDWCFCADKPYCSQECWERHQKGL